MFKLNAVKKATGGESVHDIAKELDITNAATIYCWIRNWRLKGVEGLMSKKEKLELGIYKTRAQLKDSLPDDINELKTLAAKVRRLGIQCCVEFCNQPVKFFGVTARNTP